MSEAELADASPDEAPLDALALAQAPARGIWRGPNAVSLLLLCLVSSANYGDRTIMSVLQEPMKHDLKLTDVQLGMLGGPIFAIFYAVVGIPVARLAEKSSRRRIVAVALAVWSTVTAFCGLAQNFVQMAVLRVLVGGAEAGAPPASHALVSAYFPPNKRGGAMSVLQLGVPLGKIIGAIGAGVIAHRFGWRPAFAVVGLPGLILALAVSFWLREPERAKVERGEVPRSSLSVILSLLRTPSFALVCLAGALGGSVSYSTETFIGSFFIRQYGMNLQQVGSIIALAGGVVGVIGSLISGFVADLLSRKNLSGYAVTPAIAALLGSICLFIAFRGFSETVAIAAVTGGYFFLNMLPSPTYATIQNIVDDKVRATAAAMFLFSLTVMGSFGPPVTGAISDRVAATRFPAPFGAYLTACPGGKPAPGAAAAVGQACTAAGAAGLRAGLLLPVVLLIGIVTTYMIVRPRLAKMPA